MSIYAKLALALLLAALAACQTVPETAGPETPRAGAEPPVADALDDAPDSDDAALATEPEPVEVDPAQWIYEEAINALANGNTDFAIELLTQVSDEAPDKPYVFTNLGLAYLRQDEVDRAAAAFAEAIARADDDAVAFNHLGIIERRRGNFAQALEHYRRALASDDDYAHAHMNLGILFDLYLQDLEQALVHYRRYQELISEENEQVAGWIVDIERRLN